MATRWTIELFGGLRVTCGDQVLPRFRTQKTGLLLAYLAYFRGQPHPREELIDLLWPDSPPHAARNNLSGALSWLRRHLEPADTPEGSVLIADRTALRLNPDAVSTDVAAFLIALRSAERAKTPAERVPWLWQAVQSYRGELLRGYYESWVLQEREALAERYFQALRQLIADLEQLGDLPGALDAARRAVSADPTREEIQRDLIRLYAATGEVEAAQRQYQALERLLRQELGTTPSATTRALLREIEANNAERPTTTSSKPRPATSERPSLHSKRAAAPEARITDRKPPASLDSEPTSVVGRDLLSWVGERSEPTGENRIVTVLFADMSRFVEATEALHPEETSALLDRLLPTMVEAIVRFGGQIDRFLGDGVLATFGVSRAHEDDPERAILAAIEMREAAKQLGLEVTVGINTGEVYVGPVGSDQHRERTVIGRVVNLAARLQEQAQPGQILVGAATHRPARRAFSFSSHSLTVKGIARPVIAYAIERALARPEKARGIEGLRSELIGREKELAALQEALAAALQGQGQIVCLIGEAGVGKSRLVSELKGAVCRGEPGAPPLGADGRANTRFAPTEPQPEGCLWLEGRCLELAQSTGYAAFIDLFRDYFAWGPDEDDHSRGSRLDACLQDLAMRGDLTVEQADEMGPLLSYLLSIRYSDAWDLRVKNTGPEQLRHQTVLAIRDFFVALARRQPTVLVLEDLHWADPLSLDVVLLLLETLADEGRHGDLPLLLLCVHRPEREHRVRQLEMIAVQKCPESTTEVRLRELTPGQGRRLVESLLSRDALPEPLRAQILERARGNPFFLEEIIHSLIDSGALYRDGEEWRVRDEITAVALPGSVQSVIQSRVDRLPPELKRTLECASVIGRVFRGRWLEAALRAGEMEPEGRVLEPALRDLQERALVYTERTVPEEEYSFRHVLLQETIYQSLLRPRRAALHQQVAEAIEALHAESLEEYVEPLAYHFDGADNNQKAIPYLLRAGEKARRAYLNEQAVAHFQRVLERLETAPPGKREKRWRLDALGGLGRIHSRIGREAEGERCFREAIAIGKEIGSSPSELVRLYHGLGETLQWQGRGADMLQVGEEGMALLAEGEESIEAALTLGTLATAAEGHPGREQRYRECCQRIAGFLERLPYTEELRPVFYELFRAAWIKKDREQMERWLQSLEQRAIAHHDWRALGDVRSEIGMSLRWQSGDLRGAMAPLQESVELYGRAGGAKHQINCYQFICGLLLELGDLSGALDALRQARSIAAAIDDRWSVALVPLFTGTVLLCQGNWDAAFDAFHEAEGLWRELNERRFRTYGLLRFAAAHLFRGEPGKASILLREVAISERGNPHLLCATLGRLEVALHDPDVFRAFCHRLREKYPDAATSPFIRWYLEPTAMTGPQREARLVRERFQDPLSSEWVWHDPFSDCSCLVRDGLELCAANGRSLSFLNHSAPRLLRPVSGEFIAQTSCTRPRSDRPAVGGLLLWKSRENYLYLQHGRLGEHEITFGGCLADRDVLIGRGYLPAERVFLRLERIGHRVNALCSADGDKWFTVGHVDFPVEDPVEIGLHAIGMIDRTLYPGAYPDGTAIRFEQFELWS